jgi:murein DD-endopeptidase MepM/ murein hydrolase activator NlpD
MARRFYTCIIVPDASHRLHKLRIPQMAIHAFAVLGVLSFFVAISLGFSYIHMMFKSSDYEQIQAENTQLKIKAKDLQVSTTKLSSKINDLESQAEKITKIVENDPVFSQSKKLNVKPEGGSREDITTEQLIRNGDLSASVNLLRSHAEDLGNRMNNLLPIINQRVGMDAITPNIWPLLGTIGSQFGSRPDPFESGSEMHRGLDIVAKKGTPVHAPAAGIVRFARRDADYGNLIVIDHGNGLTTRYAHLNNFAVREGQAVTKRQLIGYVGMTGRTTGPHLHYEVRLNEMPMNPRSYLPRGD